MITEDTVCSGQTTRDLNNNIVREQEVDRAAKIKQGWLQSK